MLHLEWFINKINHEIDLFYKLFSFYHVFVKSYVIECIFSKK